MKKLVTGVLLLSALLVQGQNTPGTLDLSITTIANGETYSPKHVLAIWVEDASGTFVQTLKLRAEKRKQYLYSWNNASSGNTTDANTGATLSSHQTHSLSWDCTSTSGSVLADGEYQIKVEYTSKHAQGPLSTIAFTKSADQFSFQPTDESYFKDIDLSYTPENTSGIFDPALSYQLSTYPVPAVSVLYIDLTLNESKTMQLKVYSSDMKLLTELWNGTLESGKHSFSWNLNDQNVAPGSYFVVLSGDNSLSARQVVVSPE